MNTMPTIRHGRTYYKPGPNDKNRGPLINFCSVLLITGLLIIPPLLLLGSERTRHVRYLTLRHALIESDAIIELNRLDPATAGGAGQKIRMVHGISHNISTLTFDSDTQISIPGALTLRRTPEYCQWAELQSQSCQACTRTVSAKDGSTKEENYQCNCVIQYDYIKAWRSYRINSLLFDQPGAHYNPQRDPMPFRMILSEHAKLTFGKNEADLDDDGHQVGSRTTDGEDTIKLNQGVQKVQAILDPAMLSSGVRNQPYRRVEFTPGGMPPAPSFFSRLFSSIFGNTSSSSSSRYRRYEALQSLKNMPYSSAATSDNFVYAGQGGYFFSPYESTTASKLFNLFTQYLEGSLFDWQIGDLMPSCVAGDVRFYYEVQDPNVVSVLGQMTMVGEKMDTKVPIVIKPRTMMIEGITTNTNAQETTIGLVHSGSRSAVDMLVAEDADSRNRATLYRVLVLLWSIPASRVLGVALGRDIGASTWSSQIMGAFGVFCGILGTAWLMVWGHDANGMAWLFIVAGGTFSFIALQSAWRAGRGKERRWHAVWCLIARWASLPPEWRVEDSYVVVSPESGGDDSPKKMS